MEAGASSFLYIIAEIIGFFPFCSILLQNLKKTHIFRDNWKRQVGSSPMARSPDLCGIFVFFWLFWFLNGFALLLAGYLWVLWFLLIFSMVLLLFWLSPLFLSAFPIRLRHLENKHRLHDIQSRCQIPFSPIMWINATTSVPDCILHDRIQTIAFSFSLWWLKVPGERRGLWVNIVYHIKRKICV